MRVRDPHKNAYNTFGFYCATAWQTERDIVLPLLSIRLSVCPSVRPISVLYLNQIRISRHYQVNKLCGRSPQSATVPCKLTLHLLTLKVVSVSRVTWATSVPNLVFLDLSVLDLGPMYATDRQTSDAHHRLMPLALGRDIINIPFNTERILIETLYLLNG